MLSVSGLSVASRPKSASTTLVSDVGFDVEPGQVIGVVGPSGSGKTLSGLAITGLLPHRLVASGNVTLGNNPDNLLEASKQRWRSLRGASLAYVGQNALGSLHPAYQSKTQIAEALDAHKTFYRRLTSRQQRAEDVDALLDAVDLPASAGSLRPHQLSGGMRQRVAIAMALANTPGIVVADEITTALDPATEQKILDLLTQTTRQQKMGLILITHNIGAVRRVADEIVTIDDGEVVEAGPTRRLLQNPTSTTLTAMVDADQTHHRRDPRPSDQPVLAVNEVTKTYRNQSLRRRRFVAVDKASFTICGGETVGLVGPSGSGKSTIARIICGLSAPSSGHVTLDEAVVNPTTNLRPRPDIQLVFQDPYSSLNPRRPIVDQVAEPLIVQKIIRHEALDQAAAILTKMGLPENAWNRYPGELSGGQLQRAGIGRALIVKPTLLVLDEPVAALDPPVQQAILDLLIETQEQTDVAYLFISHDHQAVARIAHRILELHERQLRPKPIASILENHSDA